MTIPVHSYVRPDFKIDCDSPLYLRMYWYSILMFIIYPLGIPTFFATLLYVHRTAHVHAHAPWAQAGLHRSLYNIRTSNSASQSQHTGP